MEFGPIRAMEGDTILSPTLPRLGIRISSDFIYLGDLQYIARETYYVEEFIFLNPSGIGHVKQLLLVHFSGFLENKEGAYQNRPHPTIHLDEDDYQHELRFIDINEYLTRYSESDLAHAADYVHQRAYTLAGDMVYHRFSRLVSADKRNQFIIAYLENNPDPQLTTAELDKDPLRAQTLLDRALASFTILH
jgi:hypothetical protein